MGGETGNTAEIAAKISKEIFRNFGWSMHPIRDENFPCVDEEHLGASKKPKTQHPADAVFYYDDPYRGTAIYLHTDLKSYGKDSITPTQMRKAFTSLAMTVACAQSSDLWRGRYLPDIDQRHEVRGLLFVYNHDHGYDKSFYDAMVKVNTRNLPVPANTFLHFLGPYDLRRLYTIANDMARLRDSRELPAEHTFYYPDLVMTRRQGNGLNQAATIESLSGPYIFIKHDACENSDAGYLIYYNRSGESVEEFEYFLDNLSHFQMLETDRRIRVRLTDPTFAAELMPTFNQAKNRYAKAWGFDSERQKILDKISIDLVTNVASTYNPGKVGWKS